MKSKQIAFNGILSIFVIITLYIASISPVYKIILYGLSALFTGIALMESDVKSISIFYVATSILAFILIPNKLIVLPYILLLGHYGLWANYFDHMSNKLVGIGLKYIILNILMLIIIVLCEGLFVNVRESVKPYILLIGEMVLIAFDIMYRKAIIYYKHRIRRLIK